VKPTTEADVGRYNEQLHEMPAYKTVIQRLDSLGATNGEREGYTVRQHVNDSGREKLAKGVEADKLSLSDFTPDKQAEHEAIINKAFNPNAAAKGDKPIAVFLMGKPAAGKSSSREKYVDAEFPDRQFTTINTDDLRAGLSDYRGWNAAATQAEAKILNTALTARALADRHNIVFDEVAGNLPKMKDKIAELGKAGYAVHIVHVDAPTHETIGRSWDRFKDSGRFVDPSYLLKDADDMPRKNYPELKAMPQVKSWKMIDNEGFKGNLIDSGSRE
jgi:adenylylsulfate kinase-like enzyme